MLVRTKRAHGNSLGAKFSKESGDEYDHPTPEQLIADGLVEEVKPDAPVSGDGKDAGVSGVRESAVATPKGDGKKRAAKGGKAADGKNGGPSGTAGA